MTMLLKIAVTARRGFIADAASGRALRERFLERQPVNGRPVLVDLRSIEAMNATAIDELLVRWITATRTARGGVVVLLWVTSPDLLRTIDLVLTDAKQAAYAWTRPGEPEPRIFQHDQTGLIGDVTKTNREALAAIIENGGAITARDITPDNTAPSTLTNRLTELATKGLVMRRSQAGRAGDLYVYPFGPRGREEIHARMEEHNRRPQLAAV